jgi:hypothetical protein
MNLGTKGNLDVIFPVFLCFSFSSFLFSLFFLSPSPSPSTGIPIDQISMRVAVEGIVVSFADPISASSTVSEVMRANHQFPQIMRGIN